MNDNERFWNKVNKRGPIPEVCPELGPCWIWMRCTNGNNGGYGLFSIGYQDIYAHRYSYEQHRGKIPYRLTLDHICRNTRCVNPKHLRVMTQRENTLCGIGPSAQNARKVECSKGHPFSESNTRIHKRPDGRKYRVCRQCQINYGKARRANVSHPD
jgi:HNH endonuclease